MVEIFKNIHKSVERESVTFLDELRRHNYVTPTSYLELLMMVRSILKEKKKEIELSIKRLRSGLDKLNDANASVEEM
jgi:dynein heavy chain